MAATYLVRFDDLCPTMNWAIWQQIEEALIDARVNPILAVVPDNRDPELVVGAPERTFWERVRQWQDRGWTIGLHGYQHRYVTTAAGIIGRNRYSEFAGLSRAAQLFKLRNAMAIMAREGVRPDIWVAPAHSFDENTLDALGVCGVRLISDGYSMLPHIDSRQMLWIPQQLGRFRDLPAGVWTVCHHHNHWRTTEVRQLRDQLNQYRDRFTGVPQLLHKYSSRSQGWTDRLSAEVMSVARAWRPAISR